MLHQPLLSDNPAVNVQFQPGDRLLVKVSCHLTPDQKIHIRRAVKRFARCDVNILIVDVRYLKVLVVGKKTRLLACPEDVQHQSIDLGVANLNCSKIDLVPDDLLAVRSSVKLDELQQKQIRTELRRWAGEDVEVYLETA